MKAVIQRVKSGRVKVQDRIIAEIGQGLVILLGIAKNDIAEDAAYLAEKIADLRIFDDKAGKINLSLKDINGQAMVVSQFTLLADTSGSGRRPSFDQAAPAETARGLYHLFIEKLKRTNVPVCQGEFQASMDVELVNAGPITIILDTAERKR